MKFKRKMLFILTLPILLSATPHKILYSFTSTNVLSKVNGDSNKTLNLFIKPIIPANYTIVSKLYNETHNTLVFANTFSEYVDKEGTNYSVNYPLYMRINSDGLRFQFEVTLNDKTTVTSGVIYPYIKNTIDAMQYKDSSYISENAFIKVETNKIVTSETFNFDNYNEYLAKEADNSIDFSTVKFNFPHNYDLPYLKAEYRIKDYNNVYPFLRHINNEAVVELNCITKNKEITFEIKEDLYVKYDTLEMSANKLNGSIKTKKLFIPIGKQDLLEENDSYILISEAGYSAIDIKLPLTYYFDRHIIGLCYESNYCISGGIREWFWC